MGVSTTAKVVAATAVAIFGATFINPTHAGATAMSSVSKGSVELIPRCVDAASNTAVWEANNKNSDTVSVSWTNLDNNQAGTFNATAGSSWFTTSYQAGLNNNTKLSYVTTDGTQMDEVERNANNGTTCDASQLGQVGMQPTLDCADYEAVRQYLNVDWTSRGMATITANQELPCDVTLYLSSYEMPDNYDGNGFYGNPTALPQHWFASHMVTLHKGWKGSTTESVNLPDACKNVQVDAYFGPEIKELGWNGHGMQNIKSDIYRKNGQTCGQPTCPCNCYQPGVGGGQQQGGSASGSYQQVTRGLYVEKTVEANATPAGAKGAAPAPAQLVNTGERSSVAAILAATLAIVSGVVALAPRRSRA